MWFFNLFLQRSKASCFHVFCLLQSRTFHFQPGTCISCHHRFISHSELIVNFPCFIFCSLFCCRHICNPVPLPFCYLNFPPPTKSGHFSTSHLTNPGLYSLPVYEDHSLGISGPQDLLAVSALRRGRTEQQCCCFCGFWGEWCGLCAEVASSGLWRQLASCGRAFGRMWALSTGADVATSPTCGELSAGSPCRACIPCLSALQLHSCGIRVWRPELA